MKADLVNLLEECPETCRYADLSVEHVEQLARVVVLIDCKHREVCSLRKGGDDNVLLG